MSERIRQAVEAAPIRAEDGVSIHVTVSVAGGFGWPSSLAVPVRLASAGNVMV